MIIFTAAVTVENDKMENADSTLLENALPIKQPRYGNSEFMQFFIILKRALLFSRRDWVIRNNIFFHKTVGSLKLVQFAFASIVQYQFLKVFQMCSILKQTYLLPTHTVYEHTMIFAIIPFF